MPFYKQCGSVLKSMMDPDESDSDADGAAAPPPRCHYARNAPHSTPYYTAPRMTDADGAPRTTMVCVLCVAVTLPQPSAPLPHQARG